jgi:general secretion pathway protein M
VAFTGPLSRPAWALAAAIVLLKQGLVNPALQSLRQADDAIAAAADRLGRIKAIAATKPALEAEAARLVGNVGQSNAFLRADTEALAGAALQERLRMLLAAQGISASAIQWAAGKGENGLGRVSVRVQIGATLDRLTALLRAIETGLPLLFIDDIDIQGSPGLQSAADNQDMPLSVAFECYGFWLGPANPAGKAAP